MKVVVDANILFSALLREENRHAEILLTEAGNEFFTPRFVVVEIFKHKGKILKYTKCSEEVLLELLHRLLKRLYFMDEDLIALPSWREAWELIKDTDGKDLPYLAMAIELDARIWTNDAQLKDGLRSKGFDRFYEPF